LARDRKRRLFQKPKSSFNIKKIEEYKRRLKKIFRVSLHITHS
jgi:hypothetical protein